jgi:hypothetical protein
LTSFFPSIDGWRISTFFFVRRCQVLSIQREQKSFAAAAAAAAGRKSFSTVMTTMEKTMISNHFWSLRPFMMKQAASGNFKITPFVQISGNGRRQKQSGKVILTGAAVFDAV